MSTEQPAASSLMPPARPQEEQCAGRAGVVLQSQGWKGGSNLPRFKESTKSKNLVSVVQKTRRKS